MINSWGEEALGSFLHAMSYRNKYTCKRTCKIMK